MSKYCLLKEVTADKTGYLYSFRGLLNLYVTKRFYYDDSDVGDYNGSTS